MWFIFVSVCLCGFPNESLCGSVCLLFVSLFICVCFSLFPCLYVCICLAKHHQTFVTDHDTNPRRQDAHAWLKRLCLWIFAWWKPRLSRRTLFFLIQNAGTCWISGEIDNDDSARNKILSVGKVSCSEWCPTTGSKTNSFKLAKGVISWDKRFHFQLPNYLLCLPSLAFCWCFLCWRGCLGLS